MRGHSNQLFTAYNSHILLLTKQPRIIVYFRLTVFILLYNLLRILRQELIQEML